ncbi:MAG: hypothetical protein ABIZ52_00470 [Candidatus Limnocylindrales bacterium]
MNATSPIHVDSGDLARLKDRMPDLSALDLPKLQVVGRNADQTIDRLLGRSRTPTWAWIATGLGLIAIIGAIATYFWMRRPIDVVDTDLDDDATTTPGYGDSTNGYSETPAYGELNTPVGVEAV